MPALYDLMLMLDPNAPQERQDEIVAEVRSAIEAKATLVGEHDWGVRRLAYEIDHRPDAAYHLFQLESEPPLLDELRHSLRIAEGVLRFRLIRLKPGSAPPPAPDGGRGRSEAVAASAAEGPAETAPVEEASSS